MSELSGSKTEALFTRCGQGESFAVVRSRDLTLNGIRRALREVIASFPVYRSYVNGGVRDVDKALIGKAVSKARKRNPMLGRPLFDFIRDTLLLKDPPSGPASGRRS